MDIIPIMAKIILPENIKIIPTMRDNIAIIVTPNGLLIILDNVWILIICKIYLFHLSKRNSIFYLYS